MAKVNIRKRLEQILEKYPKTRNSDLELYINLEESCVLTIETNWMFVVNLFIIIYQK